MKVKEDPPHQSEQVEEEVCVFSEDVEGLATEIHEQLEPLGLFLSIVDHKQHV